jgi:hypothetical protein
MLLACANVAPRGVFVTATGVTTSGHLFTSKIKKAYRGLFDFFNFRSNSHFNKRGRKRVRFRSRSLGLGRSR